MTFPDWRAIGPTTAAVWRYELENIRPGGSPMLPEADACHAAAKEHSALALAMAWVEQKYGTYTEIIPESFHNPYSISGGWDQATNTRIWRSFPTYAAGVAAWYDLLTTEYNDTTSVADLIHKYAPDWDPGAPGQAGPYIAHIGTLVARYRQLEAHLGGGPVIPQNGDGRFDIGDQIRVATGPLNIRPQPGTGNTPVGTYLAGTELCVREGPVAVDNHEWYRVDGYGLAGWVAGDFCTLLAPGGCR